MQYLLVARGGLCVGGVSYFFMQAEEGIRDAHWGLEFRRVLFRSGAGDDHVAGLERDEGRNVADQKAKAEDHPRRAVVLPQLAIDPGGEADVGDLTLVVKRDQPWSHRAARVEVLALRHVELAVAQPIANRSLVAQRNRSDMAERIALVDLPSGFTEDRKRVV